MSDTSPALGLPFIMQSQAQKHVTHNEALQILDTLVQLSVESFNALAPPLDPAEGTAYALGTGTTGLWAGQDGMLAVQQSGAWAFFSPRPGWRAWNAQTGELRIWNGSTWQLPAAETQNLDHLGVGTAADTSSRLAVSAEAALFTHDGAGHQVKVNKAGASDKAAFLFQSDWSGHAEIGLLGSNDFALKVSGDGSAWQQAVTVKADTARTGFGTASPSAHVEIDGAASTVLALTASGSGQDFLQAGDGSTLAFRFDASGNGSCTGAWSGGGADYAEYFEWADGNPENEDRRGISVICEGGRIRAARDGEDPVGIVSAAPCIIGNDDLCTWQGRYLRDSFGAVLRNGDGSAQENPEYDPARDYAPRKERPEWSCVGLVGRLRLRSGQPAGSRWVRLAVLPGGIEEWLVR